MRRDLLAASYIRKVVAILSLVVFCSGPSVLLNDYVTAVPLG